jgi:hypothetical protein
VDDEHVRPLAVQPQLARSSRCRRASSSGQNTEDALNFLNVVAGALFGVAVIADAVNFLTVAAALIAVVVLAGWPWAGPAVRAMFSMIGITLARVGVLTWSEPGPLAYGTYFRFTGMEIGNRFFGMVTSQEARIAKPETPKIKVVSR